MPTVEDFDVDIAPRKAKTEDADLDITPMIDITFLLLAFFVVVSKMDAQPPVEMPRAANGATVAEENCVVIIVTTESKGGVSKIYKGELNPASQVKVEGALEVESEITDFVEAEISNRPSIEAVLIKGSGKARTGDIETIKRGIARSELAKNRRVYFGVEEQ